ncbi:MAG: SNF2-related protein [Bryobacterales bacterium]|nr:SNF2-related protein [Bryobacterales bacterium]
MTISQGTFVRLRQDPARAGILLEGEKYVAGKLMVEVKLADGQVRWLPHSALEPVPPTAESLSDRLAGGRFVEPAWLRRTITRLRVTGRLSEVVYSMEATETDFYAYQFKPVIKLMNSPTDALLIADEVGLGKTIEAGLVWTELRARLDCDRLLVACPKTLCQKWQDELARRFGVEAQIANAAELLATLKRSRDTGRGYALICGMQGLRPPRGWDNDETEAFGGRGSARRELARFLDEASDGEPLVDLLVVDEAHHMRNPETLLNRLGRLANSVASHRLFLSATPIHLRNRDLHSLLAMVDPDTFEFETTLNDLIETNAPIIAARDLLMSADGSVANILERLDEAQGFEVLNESRALIQLRTELSRTNLDRSKRSELAARLERVNQLANYVTRTRRRDVQEFRVIREPKVPVLEMCAEEQLFYDEISEVVRDYAWNRDANELFLLSTPQRLLTSSLAAASAYWSGLVGTAKDEEIEESDRDLHERLLDERPLLARIAEHARNLEMTARLVEVDAKYRLLISEMRQLWQSEPDAKIIVFSSFKPTLHYLSGRMLKDGIGVELLHGSVKRPRGEILSRFESDAGVRVLLSSEIGSEGVDLQFSSIVVNYDLPWNPMRLEQRIGRVDRLGQAKEKVTFLNLIYDNTIDKRVYERLYERLQIGQRALGEMEAVLGEPIREMTLKLLDPTLTDKQKEEAIDQTAQVLENRRKLEDQLEAEAGSLVRHGDYIIERITESRDRHRWLSGEDILIYVRDRVLQDFPGSVIETSPVGSETYRIELSSEGIAAFQNYLARHGLKGRTRLPNCGAQQRFRFTSSIVQKARGVECISQLHPLVRFAAERDQGDDTVRNAQAVAASLGMDALPAECVPGLYVLAARRWSSGSTTVGTMANVRIGYAGAEALSGQQIDAGLVEHMIAAAAEKGRPILNASKHQGLAEAARTFQHVVQVELDRQFGDFVDRTTAEVEDRVAIRQRALVRHFENKIGALQEQQKRLEERAAFDEMFGETRRATNLKNLAAAQGARIEKLRQTWRLRETEFEAQRRITPEESDICCVLLQVAE